MLERFHVNVVTSDCHRHVYVSRAGIAKAEIVANTGDFVSVRVTPMPAFDDGQDYIVEVTEARPGVQPQARRLLRGTAPQWFQTGAPTDGGAVTLVQPSVPFIV